MCGRFARKSTQEVLAEWLGLDLEDMPWFAPTYNAAPQSIQPVIRLNRDSGRRETALLRWGLLPFWAKDAKIGYSTINARAEEAVSEPAHREALKKRRCLVPADTFYEWQRRDPRTKQPFAIALKSGDPARSSPRPAHRIRLPQVIVPCAKGHSPIFNPSAPFLLRSFSVPR
jgi:putative SOS response-associated peptidase YedK